MQATQFILVLIILLVMIYTCDSHTTRLCSKGGCKESCEEVCDWGITYNEDCGYEECAKGPSQLCNRDRQCGDGLHCLCGRCSGCSARNLDKCYSSLCPMLLILPENRDPQAYQ